MQVTVLYFATLRDRAGARREKVQLPDSATVSDLKAQLAGQHPDMLTSLGTVLVAVNQEFALEDEVLSDGDEVALFPPVSGGTDDPAPTFFMVTEDDLDLFFVAMRGKNAWLNPLGRYFWRLAKQDKL